MNLESSSPVHDVRITVAAPKDAEERVLGALSMAGLDEVQIEYPDLETVHVHVYWSSEAGAPPAIDLSRVPEATRCVDRPVARAAWTVDWPMVEVGPLRLVPVIGPREDALGTGPREDALGTGPREDALGTGPREDALGTGLREDALGTGPREDAELGITIALRVGWGFGFGEHPSTRLALEALLALARPIGPRVVDVGCGTGVLALAALRLGARAVWAVDHDPRAVAATRDNATLNGLKMHVGTDWPETSANVVIANITPPTLTRLSDRISALVAPGGRLILSGMPQSLAAGVVAAYPRFTIDAEHRAEGWVALTLLLRSLAIS